jgi:hypothetical protein
VNQAHVVVIFLSPLLQKDTHAILVAKIEAIIPSRGRFNVVTQENVPVETQSITDAPCLYYAEINTISGAADTTKETRDRGRFWFKDQPRTFCNSR